MRILLASLSDHTEGGSRHSSRASSDIDWSPTGNGMRMLAPASAITLTYMEPQLQ